MVWPTACQAHPEFCYAIYDPDWWLNCPACGINIYINLGDDFRQVLVLDSLGAQVGEFHRLEVPIIRNGVTYDYLTRLKLKKGVGYILRAEANPGKAFKGSFKPAYLAEPGRTIPSKR